jgi:hypothetical protein
MSDPIREIDVPAWVEKAKDNPIGYQQRQAIEITLTAISIAVELNKKLFLKGGILMGLAYDSPRQTTDIDLTTAFEIDDKIDEKVANLLNAALPRAAATLGYTSLALRVQGHKRKPKGDLDKLSFPALEVKIGFAKKGTKQEEALKIGRASGIIKIDISFNESINHTQVLRLPDGRLLLAYGLIDLIAEKYRAIMQQKVRKQNRRQDVYDIHRLISSHQFDEPTCKLMIAAIIEKCSSRHITATQQSLDDPEIRRRCEADWLTMELEVGLLPAFDTCYDAVNLFYKSLPWQV